MADPAGSAQLSLLLFGGSDGGPATGGGEAVDTQLWRLSLTLASTSPSPTPGSQAASLDPRVFEADRGAAEAAAEADAAAAAAAEAEAAAARGKVSELSLPAAATRPRRAPRARVSARGGGRPPPRAR